ncbi:hypothetical protein RIF29_20438 [Crotalaria pallida]|uniref:Uncharacterized protein n=1 Tax=Crotalaria pallida TaxID=3830 RepID=A0AAN9I7H2_CROPI
MRRMASSSDFLTLIRYFSLDNLLMEHVTLSGHPQEFACSYYAETIQGATFSGACSYQAGFDEGIACANNAPSLHLFAVCHCFLLFIVSVYCSSLLLFMLCITSWLLVYVKEVV